MRNRLRRQAVEGPLAADITPRNILMIGPTGVGKTEIARRLARLTGSPFIKVEASKYTEVGYVGRDVESMVRDLVGEAIQMVREEQEAAVRERAEARMEDRIIDLLVPGGGTSVDADQVKRRREAVRVQLRSGHLDERRVEIDVTEPPQGLNIFSGPGMENVELNLGAMMPGLLGGARTKRRSVSVKEAREILLAEESKKLVEDDAVKREALDRVQSSGMIFLDEIDKVAGREGAGGPDVSREGVQRDLLPIVEGTTVQTKWGPVRTDHVLFIAAGAFHVSKPSDLIPELQGRFPVRVELSSLGKDDFVRILTEPASSLTRQASALLAAEGVTLTFAQDGIEAIAEYAMRVNEMTEDIGARRLHTILETVLEDASFDASERAGAVVVVDAALVRSRLEGIVKDQDYTRYVL
jgi:ATP-dependent HslUV protease ATP-binding subunit HslU